MMSKVAGKGQLKFMIAAMGWATAELVMTRYGHQLVWLSVRWKFLQIVIVKDRGICIK